MAFGNSYLITQVAFRKVSRNWKVVLGQLKTNILNISGTKEEKI
jgi:hypothetical protein